jgi:hypothetical protein
VPTAPTAQRTPPHKAARVRDNQRRSRARHREYVDALRARLLRHEREGAQATAEVQRAARAVARENALLRALLAAQGVGEAAVAEYLRSAAVGEAAGGTGGVAGALGRALAGMEARRREAEGGGGGGARAAAADGGPAPAVPRPPVQGGMVPSGAVPVQLLPPRVEEHGSAPRQTRTRKEGQQDLTLGRPMLPPMGLALGTKRYDAIRDCLERPKSWTLEHVNHTSN